MEYLILGRPDYFDDHEKPLAKQTKSIRKVKVADDVKLAWYRHENYRKRVLKQIGQEINTTPKQTKQTSSTGTQSGSNSIIAICTIQGKQFIQFVQSITAMGNRSRWQYMQASFSPSLTSNPSDKTFQKLSAICKRCGVNYSSKVDLESESFKVCKWKTN